MDQPGEPAAETLPPTPAKPKPTSPREFEAALRELGYSKREARAIACHGFRGLGKNEGPAEELSEVATLLRRALTAIEIER